MMCAFAKRSINGEGKAAFSLGVVERGCEEFAGFCESEAFRVSDGQEPSSYPWRGRAKSHETGNPVPVDQKESSLDTGGRKTRRPSRGKGDIGGPRATARRRVPPRAVWR